MSTIFRDGSEDQVFGPTWDIGEERPADEDRPDCDSGRTSTCTGRAAEYVRVPYLLDALHVCRPCAIFERQRLEDGPSDAQTMNTCATEGGINDREWSRR